MTTIFIILILIYFIIRNYLPVFIINDKFKSSYKFGNIYELRAAEKVPIPSFNWREISTGTYVVPFGSIAIGKKFINIFGKVGCRIYPIPNLKMRGIDTTLLHFFDREEIKVILTNNNPKYPYIVRKGDVIAYLEIYKLPLFNFIPFNKYEE